MPSIRIKGQPEVHSTLDAISTNDDTLCLRGELPSANPRNTYSHTSNMQHRSLPLLPRGLLDVPSPSSHTRFGRPRSASSRVYAHCINTSRNSQHLQPLHNPLLSNTKSTPTTNVDSATTSQQIEGALSDVRVPFHLDHASIAENSINSADDSSDDEDSQSSGHHHDDVVEHLDVIGIFISFWPLFHLNFIFFTDPQVGAFSNLTNAANSIVM
jgi:hypothetical protein